MLAPAPAARPTMREVTQRLAELDGSGTAEAIEAARKKTLAGQGVPGKSTVAWAQAVVEQRKAQRKESKGRRGQGGPCRDARILTLHEAGFTLRPTY